VAFVSSPIHLFEVNQAILVDRRDRSTDGQTHLPCSTTVHAPTARQVITVDANELSVISSSYHFVWVLRQKQNRRDLLFCHLIIIIIIIIKHLVIFVCILPSNN